MIEILYILIGAVLGITTYVIYKKWKKLFIKEVITKGYYYSELSDEAKKKAIEYAKERLSEDNYWKEDIIGDWIIYLNTQGYESVEIAYSGFWSQGDGASFVCRNIDVSKWITQYYNRHENIAKIKENTYSKIIQCAAYIVSNTVNIEDAEIIRNTSHYAHAYTVTLHLVWNINKSISSADAKTIDYCFSELEALMKKDIVNLSNKIYSELERAYTFHVEDGNCISYLNDRQIWFDETGKFLQL